MNISQQANDILFKMAVTYLFVAISSNDTKVL